MGPALSQSHEGGVQIEIRQVFKRRISAPSFTPELGSKRNTCGRRWPRRVGRALRAS
jgi:hypothetical protein